MGATTLNQSPVIVQTFMGALYSSQYYAADTGGVNAISIPLAIAPNAYAEGIIWFTKFANTNTSQTVTAKVGGLAALPVVIDQAGTLPAIGSIISNMFGMLCYSSAQNKLILLNPSRALSSFTGTLTGMTATTQGTVNVVTEPDGKDTLIELRANISGTSNATTMTLTGVPANLVSGTNKSVQTRFEDNGAGNGSGFFTNTNTSTWAFGTGINTGGFTGSGGKGWLAGIYTLTLD